MRVRVRVRVHGPDCALTPRQCVQVSPPGFVNNVEPVDMMSAAGIVRAGELAVATVEYPAGCDISTCCTILVRGLVLPTYWEANTDVLLTT